MGFRASFRVMPRPLTEGHSRLQSWFGERAWLVKAHEAEAMAMTKQQLDHILSGRRRPTLDQAIRIYKHTGVEPYLWQQGRA